MDQAVCGGSEKKGAAWNYLRENKDYPYYMIKDRLARPEADSVRELRPGDGMIIGRRGRRSPLSAILMGTSIGSRLVVRTLAVWSGGTPLNRPGIVLVTAHVSNLPVKCSPVRP